MASRASINLKKFRPLPFKKGEIVLCYHGPALYEAKILHCINTGRGRYKIHYVGWNKKWDEWVPETKIIKINEENLKFQKQLFEELSDYSKSNKKAIKKINKISALMTSRRMYGYKKTRATQTVAMGPSTSSATTA